MTKEEAKDYLYATLKVLTKNTDEEIRAYIELLETKSPKMSISELENNIKELNSKKHWIFENEQYYCERCNEYVDYKTPYCSSCGAKMEY